LTGNKKYKSSVFARFFNDGEKLIEAYNAIGGKAYPRDAELEINTLGEALYLDRINDVSFLLDGKLIVLIEHQSTINENMPLRLLIYIGRVYEKILENRNIYKQKLIKIPKPEFIVLYNGEKEYPDKSVLRLSAAFAEVDAPDMLELTVDVYNINPGHNAEILQRSKSLNDYASFISRVRENRANGATLDDALKEAIVYCINNGIMKEFLEANGSEVANLLFTEFNMDDAIEVWKEEGKEEAAVNFIKEGVPLEVIARATGLPLDKVLSLSPRD
jgi:hypothetical protein